MNFDPGTIIAVAAVLIFYLRLIILQRQNVKKYQQRLAQPAAKKKGKAQPAGALARPALVIANKYLVAAGAGLILLGAALAGIPAVGAALQAAWWLPVTLGILLMSLGIR